MSAIEILGLILAHLGAGYMLVAAIGLIRMPDTMLRLHCITKSATLGVGFLLLAAALCEGTLSSWARSVAAIVFFLITAPVGAHVLGRASISRNPMRLHRIDGGEEGLRPGGGEGGRAG